MRLNCPLLHCRTIPGLLGSSLTVRPHDSCLLSRLEKSTSRYCEGSAAAAGLAVLQSVSSVSRHIVRAWPGCSQKQCCSWQFTLDHCPFTHLQVCMHMHRSVPHLLPPLLGMQRLHDSPPHGSQLNVKRRPCRPLVAAVCRHRAGKKGGSKRGRSNRQVGPLPLPRGSHLQAGRQAAGRPLTLRHLHLWLPPAVQ